MPVADRGGGFAGDFRLAGGGSGEGAQGCVFARAAAVADVCQRGSVFLPLVLRAAGHRAGHGAEQAWALNAEDAELFALEA